jgi:hypothetical protein
MGVRAGRLERDTLLPHVYGFVKLLKMIVCDTKIEEGAGQMRSMSVRWIRSGEPTDGPCGSLHFYTSHVECLGTFNVALA